MIRAARILILAAALLLVPVGGCTAIRGLTYFLRPPSMQKAEYTFPAGSKVLVMLDPARPTLENPVFERGLFDRLRELFTENKSKVELVPPSAVRELRHRHKDFSSWSVQRIGRELGAGYVLYLRVNQLQSRETPGYPVIDPRVTLVAKVIGVETPAGDARLWPTEKEGREVAAQRPMDQATSADSEDLAMTKLGKDAAWLVSYPFFDQDPEQRPQREP